MTKILNLVFHFLSNITFTFKCFSILMSLSCYLITIVSLVCLHTFYCYFSLFCLGLFSISIPCPPAVRKPQTSHYGESVGKTLAGSSGPPDVTDWPGARNTGRQQAGGFRSTREGERSLSRKTQAAVSGE